MAEVVVGVDEKGRILIPAYIRRQLNIRSAVKIAVESDRLVLKPMEDPIKRIETLMVKGTVDVEAEIGRLRRKAERELLKEAYAIIAHRNRRPPSPDLPHG